MAATAHKERQMVGTTLQGSAEIVADFFNIALNSILYVRGIYGYDKFDNVSRYGLQMRVTNDKELLDYLGNVITQLKEWLTSNKVKKLILLILQDDNGECLESWEFAVNCTDTSADDTSPLKPIEIIQSEIRNFMRQVLGSTHLLPPLDTKCRFDILIYVDQNASVSERWNDTIARDITGYKIIKLSSFSTGLHEVKPQVVFKTTD